MRITQKNTAKMLGMTYHQLRNCLRKHGSSGLSHCAGWFPVQEREHG
ncbi:MAG: hypothetical protein WDN69_37230 [Aliidongia sp.]